MNNKLKVFITNSPDMICKPMIILNSTLKDYCQSSQLELVNELKKANNIILNTCGISAAAEKQSADLFRKLLTEKNPAAKIFIVGCLAKIHPEVFATQTENVQIIKDFAVFNQIFNTNYNFEQSLKLTKKHTVDSQDNSTIPKLFFPFQYIYPLKSWLCKLPRFKTLYNSALLKDRALIEISTGCTEHCSYCSIKRAKGNLKSYSLNKILEAINQLENNPQLISLVAQDCGSYGQDIGLTLVDLLTEISKKLPTTPIEISALHPKWLEKHENFWLDIFKNYNVTEISIPIQSGTNKILKSMNREYDITKILTILSKIKKINPKIFIRTHIIVGFPGENIFDYLSSLKSMFWFDHALAIPYSDRPLTQAYNLPQRNKPIIIKMRSALALTFSFILASLKILKTQLRKNT